MHVEPYQRLEVKPGPASSRLPKSRMRAHPAVDTVLALSTGLDPRTEGNSFLPALPPLIDARVACREEPTAHVADEAESHGDPEVTRVQQDDPGEEVVGVQSEEHTSELQSLR